MSWAFDPLPRNLFDLVEIDPPWNYEVWSEKGEEKSPQAQYACLSLDQIRALPVADLVCGSAWLFLWATAPMLPEQIVTMHAWGATYVSRMTWRKTTASGAVRMGPGMVVRSCDETVLIGRWGKPRFAGAVPSIFDGLAREHSRKPDAFYALAERFAPHARRASIFAREHRPGWSCWGNELGKFEGAPA